MTTFKLGCDPEFFLKDKATGKVVPAPLVGATKGDKANPETLGQHGAWQVDGLAMEFNITPSENLSTFANRTNQVLSMMRNRVDKMYDFDHSPTAYFTQEDFDKLTEKQLELGCDPDYDAYSGAENPRPEQVGFMRTAAGHIHIGWGQDIPVDHPDHLEHCRLLVRNLDALMGLPMVLFEGEEDAKRRQMYGAAGAFRPKSYGVEYRTPSNVWVKDSAARTQMLTGVYNTLYLMIMIPDALRSVLNGKEDEIRRCINQNDKKDAMALINTIYKRLGAGLSRPLLNYVKQNAKDEFGPDAEAWYDELLGTVPVYSAASIAGISLNF